MDGLTQYSNLLIIGTTNRLNAIDPAALRPGRFSCKLLIDIPTDEQRLKIIKMFAKRFADAEIINEKNFDAQQISNICENVTGAQIEHIFNMYMSEYINKKLNDDSFVSLDNGTVMKICDEYLKNETH
jgi:SpoVK/Ycf46/Vps4 family AAA+-type ATPase